ncbi:Calx-beta domain-containing protein [Pseudomonas sp. OHS18]|uniref:Calx-beta domain-containing protein n=1 Tax=Pseudomonas sp. OHS18 TaxID=3399679 RepID=UPI003A84A8BF
MSNDTTPTITGTTDAPVGSTVTLTVTQGSTVITVTTPVLAGGTYTVDVPQALAEGSYTVIAQVSDPAGNIGSATDSGAIDVTAPVPTITLDANITADDVINSTEAGQQIPVTGTVGGDAKVGDIVTLTVNGNTYTGLVTNTNGTLGFSINVPGSDLVADAGQTITASISTTDAAGNVGTASDTEGYSVDTTAPAITVDAPAVSNDTTPTITGTTDAPVGSTVTLTITQGSTVTTVTTPVLAGGTYTVDVPQTLAEGPYSVEAQVTDPAGNTGSATDNGAIDTLAGDTGAAPVVTITEDANNDGIISKAELNGPVDVRVGLPAGAVAGDTLVITNGTTPQTVTLTAAQIAAGFVTTTFANPGEGTSITVEATLRDQFGNTSEKGTDTAKVDTLAGTTGAAPVVTITEDANNDGIISKAELNGPVDVRVGLPAGAVAGDTLVITNGTTPQTVTLTAAQITAGFVTTTFPSPGEGNSITVEATLRDQFGNTSEKDTDTAKVDTLAGTTGAAPVVTITEDANNDGIISKAELNGPIDVRVGLPAGAVAGDTLVITNGTTPQTVTLTAAQITAGFVTTTFANPGEGNTLTVEATLRDQFGNTSEKGTDTAKVDTLAGTTGAAPVVTITEDANNDGIISKAELNGPVDVRVGLPAGAVAGDTLVITNGTTPQTVTLTAAQITAGFVTTTFPSPGEGNTLTVEATLQDQFGNTSNKGTDSARVDTLAGATGAAPTVEIREDINNDGVIGQNELSGAIDVRVGLPAGSVAGDTISVTDGTTIKTFTLTTAQITTGHVDTTFANPGEGKTITVEATLQDQFGNTSGKGSDQALANSNPVAVDDPVGSPYTVTIGDLVSGSATNNWANNDSNNQQTLIQARDGNGDSATLLQLAVDGNQNALGVAGSPRAVLNQVPDQLEYDPTTGKTESITLNFSGNLNQADFRVSRLIAAEEGGEVGRWVAMYEGVEVASGTFKFSGGGSGTFSLDTGTQVFDSIRFEALPTANGAGDGSDYFLTGFSGSGPASANSAYVVNESQTLVIDQGKGLLNNDSDAQANQTLGVIKINGADVPADGKVALATGVLTVNADGSFNFAANDNNLKSGEIKTQNFTYTVSDGYGGTATATATITIIGTEVAPGIGAVSAAVDSTGGQVDEGDNAVFTVSLTNASSTASTFNLSINPGTANAGSDYNAALTNQNFSNGVTYNATTGQVTVPGGVTSFTVSVPTINDTVSEPSENFSLTVGGKTGTATIIDNDAAPTVGSVSAAVDSAGGQVDEGDNAVFTVNLTNASSTPTTFSLALNAGTATAGSDYNGTLTNQSFSNGVTYNAATGQVTVPAGVTSFTVTVPTINDTVSEPSENFSLTVGGKTGTATIIDNDAAPSVGSVSAAVDSTGGQVDEGDNAVFTVNLSNASSTPTTLSLALNAGTATAGSDYNAALTNQSFSNGVTYNAATGQITVPAGVTSFTVSVPTLNDTVHEQTETFSLTVGGQTGTATIIDNDAAPTVSTVSAAVDSTGGQVDEGDNAVFTVNLTNASSTATSFSLALNPGSALPGFDYNAALTNQSFSNGVTYNALTGVVAVPAGVTSFTVTVPTINDTVAEPTETFTLTVGGKTGTATIIDNDAAPTVSTVSAAVDSTGGQVDEGDNAVFTVNLSNAGSTPTTFSLALNPGTATAGSDYNAALNNQSFSNGVVYNAITGQVTVPAGVTSFTVTVPTINDTVSEPTETFSLSVGGKTGTATIIDNDAAPTVSTVNPAVDSAGGQVDEGDNAVFTVNLSNASSTPTTFSLALNAGTATAGSDYNGTLTNQSFSNGVTYNAATGQVTVPAGVTSFTVTVPTINDTVSEPTESFTLTVGGQTGTAAIIDNDAAPTVGSVSAAVDSSGGQVDEGDNAVFTVNLSNASSTPTTFSLALNAGTATAGSDYNAALTNQSFSNGVTYNAATGQVTVPAGVTSFTVTVPTVNDTVAEPTETFSLTVGGQIGTATIIDNDAAPTVGSVSAAVDSAGGQVDEGDNAVFTINLTNASSTATTFSLALNAGTATAGSDYNGTLSNQSFSNGVTYNAATGQVTVPAGVTSFTVTVPTINDTVSEPTETFTLTVGGQTGTATIIDNDAAPSVSTVSAAVDSTGGQVDEGDNAVFTVNLTNASSTPTTFSLALTPGMAVAGSDYNATLTNQSFSNGVTYNAATGQVTVPAGVTSFTVTVPTINDTVSEPTETFSLTVGGKTGTATIIDNDAAPTVSTVSAAVDSTGGQVDEGDNAVFTVNLTNASSTPTTFSLALTPGTAVAGSDYNAALTNQSFSNGVTYNAATGQVTVPAGVTSFTVTVPTINDTVSEPTETFTLNVGGKIGTATIIDNDPVPTVKTIDVGQPGTADDNVVEGNNLVFNVTLSNASSTPTVLAFNATGTATANVDYKLTAQSFSNGVTYDASTGKITVPAGVTTFSVTVQTLADNVVAEPLETVKLDIGGLSATGGIIDGTPDAKDDSYTRITGLKAEYYGYNDASTGAGNDGANLTNLSQVRQFIDSHNPAATFNATKLDYGTLSNASGLGNGTNLQNFLGVDVASGNGAKANSLSTDPGNTSDAIIKMGGYINLAAGTYQFKVTADDGYSIRINGQVVAEFNNIQSTSTATGQTFTISAAQAGAQQIEIIYWDQGGDARLKVELGQGGTFKVVDSDMLYHVPSTSSLVVESGDSLTIAGSTLLGNDIDPNGDALSITSVQNATNGTVTLNNGNVVFTPKAGFYGDASFQYTVNDGKGGSDIATVTLKVNQPADTIRVAGSGANDNGDNTIGGGAGNDVLLGDAGGTLTTLQPATNYNIALLVDTSGSMQGDRMSLTKSALSNFAKTLAGHDGVVNLTLVGFAGDVTLSTKVADLQNGSKLDSLLADIQRLTANGGTNYEAAFKEASAWFDAQSAAGNTKAAGYENLTFFLSDGDPTFYYNGNTTTVSGNGSTTNDQVLLGSLDTFNVLAGKSAVQAIGIGSGVSQKNLSLFDNTTDAPASTYLANGSAATLANFDNNTTGWNNLTNWQTSGTGTFNGSVGRSGDALMIRDTVGGSPVTATTPSLTIADGAFSSLRFAYGTTDTGNGDALSWKLQQLVQGVWTDVQTGGGTTGGNWTTAETAVVGAGTYRLAFSVDDKSSNFASATMAIDNITRVDYTKVPVGKVEIVNSADELSVALHGGSNANVPVTVGNDTISGGDGNDIIFGDVINTDGLKWGVDGNPTRPADLHDGAGVKALETFLELKNGIAPSNGDLYDYIRANHETFNVAGDTRGGADKLYGGGGNDILYGQGGNDLLVGGAGDDILFGGAGADTFAWQKGDFGKDVIKDFNVAEGDTIDLSSLLQDHSNNLDSYLKLVTDNGSSTLLISTKGEFNTADTSSQQVAAKADVQIDLGQASLPSYDINTLIANHTIKVDP